MRLAGQFPTARATTFVLAAALAAAALVPAKAPAETRVPESAAEMRLGFAPVVRRAAPAVVNIYARREVSRPSPFADDPFFSQFFREFGAPRPEVENALGSGVILSPEGIVVSNYHVVGGAREIRVVLADRREYDAEILMGDADSDLAVLRLRGAEGLPALELADSDAVEVGDLVLAIGNPFGIGQTVSSGIISGLARAGLAALGPRSYFIQTDAAINPGNSGGARVDMAGRLVGVNTAILSRSGGSQGVGLAIPANLVARFVAQAEGGATRFTRPWAGVAGQTVGADLLDGLGLARPQGVILAEIHPESPFAKAGLRLGDVVLALDGQEVNAPAEMLFRMTVIGVGNAARVSYLRAGERREAAITLTAPPEVPPRDPVTIGGRGPLRGLGAVNINPGVALEYDLPADIRGVVVTALQDTSARLGLLPGDVILAINGIAVDSTRTLERVAGMRERFWEIDLVREGRRSVLRFRL